MSATAGLGVPGLLDMLDDIAVIACRIRLALAFYHTTFQPTHASQATELQNPQQ